MGKIHYTSFDLRSASTASRHFEPEPASARAVRGFVRDFVRAQRLDADTAILLADELATNAVLHARCPYEVTIRVNVPLVRVEVWDGNVRLPVIAPEEAEAFSGRGLRLVDAASRRWGVEPTAHGKVVWFELVPDFAGSQA